MVPDSSMTPPGIESNDEALRCDTASMTSRYLAWVSCIGLLALHGPFASRTPVMKRAPVAVRNWRYSVAKGLCFSMDG